MSGRFVQVAVALPLPQTYTYRIPPALVGVLEIGHGVLVPFGARKVSAFVVGFTNEAPVEEAKLKAVVELLSIEPLFEAPLLPLFEWIARYYHHPLGEVLRTALPSGVQRKSRKVVTVTEAGRRLPPADDAPGRLLTRLAQSAQGSLSQGAALTTLTEAGAAPDEAVRLLRRLLTQGLVAVDQALTEARAGERQDDLFTLVVAPGRPDDERQAATLAPFKRPGPVQVEVAGALVRRGAATAAEVRAELAARGIPGGRVTDILKALAEAGVVEIHQRERMSTPRQGLRSDAGAMALTADQADATAALHEALHSRRFHAFLLQGVTGSGKTEVYLRAARATLDAGRQVIVVVPEISLTPQLLGRFQAWFGEDIACLHSDLSDQERFDAWRRIRRGEARVVVGARSAIFAPFPALGLIVVDEEHDGSFKQDDGLAYNGRDLAVVRGRMAEATVILGSATPSLETRHNAERGIYRLAELPRRVRSLPLPEVTPLDMRRREHQPQDEGPHGPGLAPALVEALRETFERGQQAILLLNRRGFAPFVLCPRCGGSFRCLQCDVSMTFHRRRNLLMCHHCGASQRLPEGCPQCGYPQLELSGAGTERLEGALGDLFPGVSIGRMDRDTAGRRDAWLDLLGAFREGRTQLLVGTQMLAKGHDFPGVTCVGILQADYLLNLPDFRAAERTFQLVTQVSGRAGRGAEPGRVFVQSHTPDHFSLAYAAAHDYEGFYTHELRYRRLHRYPPFSRLALIHVSAQEESTAADAAQAAADALRAHQRRDGASAEIEVLGPAPAPLARLKGWYRFQILLKAPTAPALQRFLAHGVRLAPLATPPNGVRLSWDVDPVGLL